MRLLNDRVLLERLEGDDTTSSGIFIASTAQPFKKGKVLAVGNGLLTQHGERVPLVVEKGDEVLYQNGAGVDYDGNLMVNESHIVAVL